MQEIVRELKESMQGSKAGQLGKTAFLLLFGIGPSKSGSRYRTLGPPAAPLSSSQRPSSYEANASNIGCGLAEGGARARIAEDGGRRRGYGEGLPSCFNIRSSPALLD